ncbi:hypothetical protein K504DRAFT_57576 [Pleomassaria siparia CBS 279.74]|uniref:Uncharacterized protein n=1 Tax=Pleomassaria siparia CBS 279.74 TaxID=1314801 RepID=A0A6G1K3X2_9PLEO|nr:hypothetical protein K504DRAFT_57576 [Pleomassaria siparia CBS 279.74]
MHACCSWQLAVGSWQSRHTPITHHTPHITHHTSHTTHHTTHGTRQHLERYLHAPANVGVRRCVCVWVWRGFGQLDSWTVGQLDSWTVGQLVIRFACLPPLACLGPLGWNAPLIHALNAPVCAERRRCLPHPSPWVPDPRLDLHALCTSCTKRSRELGWSMSYISIYPHEPPWPAALRLSESRSMPDSALPTPVYP